jgi:transposase
MLRGGSFPEAYVYPRQMRATRDLLRRRLFFVRKRGELFAHIRNTFHQYNLPRPSGQLLYRKNREGLVEAFSDSMIRSTIEADTVIRGLERRIGVEVQVHDPETFVRLQTTPGVGKVLALTLLYDGKRFYSSSAR